MSLCYFSVFGISGRTFQTNLVTSLLYIRPNSCKRTYSGELSIGSLKVCNGVVWLKGDLNFRLESCYGLSLMSYLSQVTCHAHFLPFSSVQFYRILPILVFSYFDFL